MSSLQSLRPILQLTRRRLCLPALGQRTVRQASSSAAQQPEANLKVSTRAFTRVPSSFEDLYQPSDSCQQPATESKKDSASKADIADAAPKRKKTQAQLDEELRLKMSGLAGDGGESGIEYEDGQPVSMKRGVKNNMFRYI